MATVGIAGNCLHRNPLHSGHSSSSGNPARHFNNSDANTDANTDADANTNADTDADADADTDADTDADANTNTDADANANTDTDTDALRPGRLPNNRVAIHRALASRPGVSDCHAIPGVAYLKFDLSIVAARHSRDSSIDSNATRSVNVRTPPSTSGPTTETTKNPWTLPHHYQAQRFATTPSELAALASRLTG